MDSGLSDNLKSIRTELPVAAAKAFSNLCFAAGRSHISWSNADFNETVSRSPLSSNESKLEADSAVKSLNSARIFRHVSSRL